MPGKHSRLAIMREILYIIEPLGWYIKSRDFSNTTLWTHTTIPDYNPKYTDNLKYFENNLLLMNPRILSPWYADVDANRMCTHVRFKHLY